MSIEGWHFAGETLRDGSPLPKAGHVSDRIYEIEMCWRGWHMSERAIDALVCAPGPYVARVQLEGRVIHGEDKDVGEIRMTLTDYADATDVLLAFARECALSVAHLWAMPATTRLYLESGDPLIRDAAMAAVKSSVMYSAMASFEAATKDALCSAARDAARYAARGIAGAAAEAAAWAAVGYVVRGAAWAAARDAAWPAARVAAVDEQNDRLEAMLWALLRGEQS